MKDADGCLIFSTKRRKVPGIPVSAPDGLAAPVKPDSALQTVEQGLLALESEVVERLKAQSEYTGSNLLEMAVGDRLVYPVKPNA